MKRRKQQQSGNALPKILMLLGLAGLGIYAVTNKKGGSGIYTYGNGAYQVIITSVDKSAQGFGFAILVNGHQVFADNYYYGDINTGESGSVDSGDYTVTYLAISDDQVRISVASRSQGKELFHITLYLNGTQVSPLVTPDPLNG